MLELSALRLHEQPWQGVPEHAARERVETEPAKPIQPQRADAAPAPQPHDPAPRTLPAAPRARAIPPLQRSVEAVLQEGLESLYLELAPAEQRSFRDGGEALAAKLAELIQRVSLKVAEVLQLIREWLMGIPGINRYYLEQAAKIKADKILRLH